MITILHLIRIACKSFFILLLISDINQAIQFILDIPTTLCFSASQICFFIKKLQDISFQAKVASWYFFTFTFLEFFVHFFHLPRPGSHHQSLLHPDFSQIIQLLTWNLKLFSFSFWNIVVQYFGSEWPWSNRLLGCHLILRNIKSIMIHLLWDIWQKQMPIWTSMFTA